MSGSPIGDALSSFSTAYSRQKQTLADRAQMEEDNRYRREALRYGYNGAGYQGEQPGRDMSAGYGSAPSGGGGGRATPISDPVSETMPAYQRAFLNTIADGESNGAYDVRYTPNGGVAFDPSQGHPRIFEPTHDGRKSSAAGRYQFTWTTWKGLMGEDAPFTPENQDRAAWMLAERDYKAHTGRDINEDLQNGTDVTQIMATLSPTWQAFSNRGELPNYAQTYAESLQRYSAAPSGARSVAPTGPASSVPLSFGQEVVQNATNGFATSPLGGIMQKIAGVQ